MQTAVNPPGENSWHEVILTARMEVRWLITVTRNNMKNWELEMTLETCADIIRARLPPKSV